MSAMLDARDVSYRGDGRLLVNHVDITIETGRFTVVVGPNGAGKSTLLRLLCGELQPSTGEITVDGRSIRAVPPWRLAHLRAVMPQASELNFPFTAFEVASLGVEGLGRGLSRAERLRMVDESLAQADVAHLAGRNYQTLSGGERQRVHFARVLTQLKAGRSVESRQILFLDEPIASLDLKHQLTLLAQARRLSRDGLAVVAVLHDLQHATALADDLVLMHDARVVAKGAPGSVLTAERLAAVFGVTLTTERLPPHPWTLAAERGADLDSVGTVGR